MKNVVLATLFVILGALTFAQDAQTIIEKADEYRGSENWSFDLKVVDFAKEAGKPKVTSQDEFRVIGQVFTGSKEAKVYKSLCQFTKPVEEQGKKMFMDGQIYWMFFPDAKNLVRITPAQRLSGQATASDIASINFANDYTGKLMGEETLLKKFSCYKLKLTQKNENVAYSTLNYWVEKVSFKPLKVEFFGSSGKLLKTGYYRDFKPVAGKMQALELFIIDPVQDGHVTRLIQSNKSQVKVPEYYFRKDTFPKLNLLQQVAKVAPQDIVEKADAYRGGDKGWGWNLQVIDMEKSGKQIKMISQSEFRIASKVYQHDEKNVYKSFVQFTAPKKEVGKKMLMEGQIYWMSFPETKNLVRITPAQRLAGQATASDIASTNFSTDYQGKVEGMEKVLKKNCYKLKLTAKHENTAYASLNYWVEQSSFQPVKVEYFAASGKLLKTAYFRNLKMAPAMMGVKVHELFIVDPVKVGHVTRMIYTNLHPESRPDHFFTKDSFTKYSLAEAKINVTPKKIIQNADAYRGGENWAFNLEVIDFHKNGKEVKILGRNGFSNVSKTFKNGGEQVIKVLCDFTSPKTEVGKKMLMDGQVYWMFFPNTKNLVRITPAQRLAGQATASDIASTNFEYDYSGQFDQVKEEVVFKSNCYRLILTAKPNKNVAYPKLNYWVEKETFKPIKIEYFSSSGKHLKTAYYRDFKAAPNMGGKIKSHELFIVDPVQKGHVTRMLYSGIKTKESPDYLFAKDQLNK